MAQGQNQDYPRLGRYQLINRIASGGMAEVFLGRAVGAMGFQREVALKLIRSSFSRDPDFVKMFIDEARIAMHLHHRNIVQVFDLDQVGDTYFIAMEYVHGVNVHEVYERLANKGRWFEVPTALYLVAEVCKGLHFAHTRCGADGLPLGIIHRDVSPQNVLLSFEGEVKLTDFGIATAAQRLHQTAAGVVKGKFGYMAPERLADKAADARADVFGLGVLLYELLVGENPFAGASAMETIENVRSKRVPLPSERGASATRELDALVLSALAKDPKDRIRSAQALAEALTEQALKLANTNGNLAAGDTAIAALLGELFPERAGRLPPADPRSLGIPGLTDANAPRPSVHAGAAQQSHEHSLDDDATTMRGLALRATPEPGAAALRRAPSNPALNEDSAFEGLLGLPTSEALVPLSSTEVDTTLPMELSSQGPAPFVGLSSLDDTHAPTLQSRKVLASLEPVGFPALAPPRMPRTWEERASTPENAGARRERGHRRLAALLAVAAALVTTAAAVFVRTQQEERVSLRIITLPAGAAVLIDGQPVAQPTPTTIEAAADQTLTVELSRPGFDRVRRRLRPVAGMPITLEESLSPSMGSLTVRPSPSDAEVFIQSAARGRGTVTVAGLPLGQPISVRLTLDGYSPHEETVTLSANAPSQTLSVPLVPIQPRTP